VDDQMDNLAENIVEYNRRGAITHSSVGSGSGGGGVDEILKRLGSVETQVAAILATIPHLATKADLGEVKTMIADTKTMVADVKTQMASKEAAMIKWIVATVLTTAGVAFGLAKFLH
jgi:hypothetical protein